MEEHPPYGTYQAESLPFSCRLHEAMIAERQSLDKFASTSYNYHISAVASHSELYVLRRVSPIILVGRLNHSPLQVQQPFIPIARCLEAKLVSPHPQIKKFGQT